MPHSGVFAVGAGVAIGQAPKTQETGFYRGCPAVGPRMSRTREGVGETAAVPIRKRSPTSEDLSMQTTLQFTELTSTWVNQIEAALL